MQSKLENYRLQINRALEDFFASDLAAAGFGLQGFEQEAFEILKEFSLRPGKRIRGALSMFAYEQLGGEPKESALQAAVVQELVQSYLLIIDDVMDRSPTRRGKPTVHKILSGKFFSGQERLAEMQAINIGLLALHIAMYLLSQIKEEPVRLNAAASLLNKNIMATIFGQVDDLNNSLGSLKSERDILRLLELKVSYYSFISPLELGAVLAGKNNPKFSREIEVIGKPAGIAFQLHDDLIGLFGKTSETGKSVSDDLKEGKITLLMLYTLERATKQDADKLRSILGNQTITEEDYEKVCGMVEGYGAKAAVEDKAKHFGRQAKTAVSDSTFFGEEAKQFLTDLIDYLTNRNN